MAPDGSAEPSKGTVMIVDDDTAVRGLLALLLQRAGYRIVQAEDGAHGLALLANEDPVLICVDYMMPGLDGPAVVQQIRQRATFVDTPIMLLTASAAESSIEQAFAAGANDYITKPFDRRVIVARVESAIRAARDRKRAAAARALEAQRKELLTDLESASHVQRAIAASLPREFPGGTIAGTSMACQHIGGDTIVVLDAAAGGIIAALIDVSGHGAAAALVASSISAELRQLAASQPLADSLARLNQSMTAASTGHFACIGAVALTGRHATIVNAGLPPICVIRRGDVTARIEASGVPPGLLTASVYGAVQLELYPGDRVVIVSDGLTEPLGDADHVDPCLIALGLLSDRPPHTRDEFEQRIRTMFAHQPLEDDVTVLSIALARDREAGGAP